MATAAGYFEAWTNEIRKTYSDGNLLAQLTRIIQRDLGGQVHKAGSQAKGTGIDGSDLDYCVMTNTEISLPKRRELARVVAREVGRATTVQYHVIRIAEGRRLPKVDMAFARATFGSRKLPDVEDFRGQPKRQQAARALKTWARAYGFPWTKGWALERFVVHLDSGSCPRDALTLTRNVLDWLANRANQSAVESVLRPHAEPEWSEEWSRRLAGRIEALGNAARRTLSQYRPEGWRSGADAGRWLTG
jgi:hypothetical protein